MAMTVTLKTLVNFSNTGTNASYPTFSSLIADAHGNLFGTTIQGGAGQGQGTVFEIVKHGSHYAKHPTILVSFQGPDGNGPDGGVIIDAHGNLFGTTGNRQEFRVQGWRMNISSAWGAVRRRGPCRAWGDARLGRSLACGDCCARVLLALVWATSHTQCMSYGLWHTLQMHCR
jgi:uncharacterized repeat protein (TIGR03803 family)